MSNETQTLSIGVGDTAPWYRTTTTWLNALGGSARKLLVYSTLYLVGIAMVETLLVVAVLDVTVGLAPVIIGLLTFSVYAGDRIADLDTDAMTNPGQTRFLQRYKTLFSVGTAVAYGLAIMLALTAGPVVLVVTLLPGGFWILYASDWLPRLGSYMKRLKDVLVVNSGLVAVAWAITLTLIPLAWANAPFSLSAAFIFTYFLLDRFINTEIPNLNDIAGDAAIGVDTLPVVYGEARTRQMLYGLATVLGLLIAAATYINVLSTGATIAFLVGVLYTGGLVALVGRTEQYGRLAIASELKHLLVFGVLAATTGGLPI